MVETFRARFIGVTGEFLNGVPARDLTEAEYQALDLDKRKLVRECGLYDVRSDAEMRPPQAKPIEAATPDEKVRV